MLLENKFGVPMWSVDLQKTAGSGLVSVDGLMALFQVFMIWHRKTDINSEYRTSCKTHNGKIAYVSTFSK